MTGYEIALGKVHKAASETLRRMRDHGEGRGHSPEGERLSQIMEMAEYGVRYGAAERMLVSLEGFALIQTELERLR